MTTLLSTPSVPDRGTLVDRLEREWNTLADDPRAIARAHSWQLTDTPVTSLDDVLRALGYECHDPDADDVLRRLMGHCGADDLAARVVLRRIMPGLLAIARRRGADAPGGARAIVAELLPTAWLVIRAYPIDRRPGRVAASILRDVEYEVFARQQRRLAYRLERCTLGDDLPDSQQTPGSDPLLELAEVLREARDRGLPDHDLRLLAQLASGRSCDDIALEIGCTGRTIRNHRRELVVALRRHLDDDPDATWPASTRRHGLWAAGAPTAASVG